MFTRGTRSFLAKFPGICDDCQDGFEREDEIAYNAANQLVHADPDDCNRPASTRSSDKVCGKCFLVHAGDCF